METNSHDKKLHKQLEKISYPAAYQIVVQGKLDIGWSERLSNMTITITGGGGRRPQTTLGGKLVDQSALLGVLNTLHDLQYGVLKVEYFPAKKKVSGK
jgi:hypothetical protein